MVFLSTSEKQVPGKFDMVRDSRALKLISQIGLVLLYIVRDCFQTIYRPSSRAKDAVNGSGRFHVVKRAFGWPPPKLDPNRETAWLDGLRGMAAFLVMVYHYHLTWEGPRVEAPYGAYEAFRWHFWRLPVLRVFYASGHAQVCVFFVLSGFVLSWGTLGSIRAARHDKIALTLSSAVFRRWWRLYLPCFMVGGLGMILYRMGLISLVVTERTTIFGQAADWVRECLRWSNPFRLEREGFATLFAYNWTMWTIPDEFAGSLLVFALCLGMARIENYHKRVLIELTIATWAHIQAFWTYWLFATGVLLADYVREAGGFKKLHERTSRFGTIWWSLVFFAGVALAGVPENNEFVPKAGWVWIYGLEPSNWYHIEGGVRYWWSWAGILILAGACHLTYLQRFFETAFIRHLGRISFMLYVTHRTIEELTTSRFRKILTDHIGVMQYNEELKTKIFVRDGFSEFMLWAISWAVVGPLALIVAHWCEVYIDAPCTRFAKWLDDKFTNGFFPEHRHNTAAEEDIGLLPIQRERLS